MYLKNFQLKLNPSLKKEFYVLMDKKELQAKDKVFYLCKKQQWDNSDEYARICVAKTDKGYVNEWLLTIDAPNLNSEKLKSVIIESGIELVTNIDELELIKEEIPKICFLEKKNKLLKIICN